MRKISILLSIMVLAAMVLAACGGGATSTNVVPTQLPVTSEATEMSTATEVPTTESTATEVVKATETPGIPVTGETNAARMSNELEFKVMDKDGNEVGNVSDMVLDLGNTKVTYVIVGTGGILGVGEKKVAVPWNELKLETGTGTGMGPGGTSTGNGTATPAAGTGGTGMGEATSTPEMATGGGTGGLGNATSTPAVDTGLATSTPGTGTGSSLNEMRNVFILQTSQDTLKNAPEFDPNVLPQMGQPSGNWDAAIRSYWQNPGAGMGTGAGQATSTPGTGSGTGTGLATATPGTDTSKGTVTPAASMGGTGKGTQGATALQGVALASDVIGSTVTVGMQQSTGTGMSTSTPAVGSVGKATATPGSGTGSGTSLATATPASGNSSGTGTGSGTGTSQSSVSATIDDMIVNPASGDIQFIVIKTTIGGAEHLIPVPLALFRLDTSTREFILKADAAMLEKAPSFENGQFPDTEKSGWDKDLNLFWKEK